MVSNWMKRLKMMRISKYAIIICLLLSLVFAGFTIYGANTGNFNIYVAGSDVSVAVYMKDDKSDLGSHLSVPTLEKMYDNTFSYLPADIVSGQGTPERHLGTKNDEYNRYMAFSLCLVNRSERAIDYTVNLSVVGTREGATGGKVISAMRVALIKGEEPLNTAKIYAAPESTPENEQFLNEALKEYGEYPTPVNYFISEEQLFSEDYNELPAGGEEKFTVIIWLEGCDVDCIDNLFGGKIRMRLDFLGK